jgi:hypothetical protein
VKEMSKVATVLAIATILVAGAVTRGISKPTPSLTGSWQVDTRHSDAQLITDATTDYGKTKIDVTLGFGRVNGGLILDESDQTKCSVDLRFYPPTSMSIELRGSLQRGKRSTVRTRSADGQLVSMNRAIIAFPRRA